MAVRRAGLARERLAAVDSLEDAATDQRETIWSRLAASAHTLGIRLSNLGRREEALAASQESVDIRRRLTQARPDAFLPNLAMSLNNLGAMLSNLGRREEALAASQEAVDLYRRLAQVSPDAFLPDLAKSLGVTSHVLTALDRQTEAAQAAHEALEILAPFVERYPETFADLARAISANLRQYSDAAQQAPDLALLERVGRALGGGETAAEDPAIEALKPKLVAILEEAEATGVLDEAVLAEFPEWLVDGLRTAWSERSGEAQ